MASLVMKGEGGFGFGFAMICCLFTCSLRFLFIVDLMPEQLVNVK